MLTVDFDRLGLRAGERVLDMGCGAGRHAFVMYKRGADVIALDMLLTQIEETIGRQGTIGIEAEIETLAFADARVQVYGGGSALIAGPGSAAALWENRKPPAVVRSCWRGAKGGWREYAATRRYTFQGRGLWISH